MNIIVYAGFSYFITAVIAYAVMGVIVSLSRFLSQRSNAQ
ncbi:hypothetical protein F11_06825 [Rhodospirillum rubrum F11]|nr:hypothetical protein F11_06825 [Rhodospirillum rubrum F11]